MFRWVSICVIASLLLLAACSRTSFVYNRLDVLLPWYLRDYVELTSEQRTLLDQLLPPFLGWHRQQELPQYIGIIERIDTTLERPLTPGAVAAIYADMHSAWSRLQHKSLHWLLPLASVLSAEQVSDFEEHLQARQREFEEKYLSRSDREYRDDTYDALLDNLQGYLGRLDRSQRQRLRAASAVMVRVDSDWLQEQAAWLQQLGIMLQRQPGWQQSIRTAVVQREAQAPPHYRATLDFDLQLIFVAIADVLNSRTPKQDARLRRELQGLRESLQTLVAQGAVSIQQ